MLRTEAEGRLARGVLEVRREVSAGKVWEMGRRDSRVRRWV